MQFSCLLKCRLKVPGEYCLIGFTSWGHSLGLASDLLLPTTPSLPVTALLSAQPKLTPQSPPSTAPMEQRMWEGFSQCVGFSSSEAQGHLHTLSLWNGPLVAAPGRAQWCLYQPVKRDSPGLLQVPLSQSNSSQSTDGCSFTSVLLLRRGDAMLSPLIR